MARELETKALSRGLGRLLRYSTNGPWTWQYWNRQLDKWVTRQTGEVNLSLAQQWVIQQSALRSTQAPTTKASPVLFKVVAKEYLRVRSLGDKCPRLRPSTLERVATVFNAFDKFLGPRHSTILLHQINEQLLTSFLEHLADQVSVKTANGYFDLVGQVLDFAVQRKHLAKNPAKSVQHLFEVSGENEPEDDSITGWACPTADELRQILTLAAVKLTPTGERAFNGSDMGRPVFRGINQNDYVDLYTTLSLTGLRIGEARFLTWDDVDFSNKVIHVRSGRKNGIYWQPKTKSSIRRVPIIPPLEAILSRLLEKSRKKLWVFESRRGTQLSQNNPSLRFREICDHLGFKKHFVVHSLRKYWASTVAQQGMDAMMMIRAFGHTDFKLIMSTYYSQNDDARMVAEASKIDFGLGLEKAG